MAVTFEQARRAVQRDWPDYEVATYGFETDADWILALLPERAGGRIPVVAKKTGTLRWTSAYSDDYSEERPVGSGAPERAMSDLERRARRIAR